MPSKRTTPLMFRVGVTYYVCLIRMPSKWTTPLMFRVGVAYYYDNIVQSGCLPKGAGPLVLM